MWNHRTLWLAALCLVVVCSAPAPRTGAQPKDVEPATRQVNAEVLRSLRRAVPEKVLWPRATEQRAGHCPGRLEELMAMLDDFSLGFPIVEPRPAKG